MRWQQNTCPTCAKPAAELAEMVAAQALLTYDEESGEYEYAGESRVCWDGQETLEADGMQNLYCENGHDWWTAPVQEHEGAAQEAVRAESECAREPVAPRIVEQTANAIRARIAAQERDV